MAQPASACSAAAVYPAAPSKVIDLTPHLQRRRRNRRQAVLHTVLALWTQYLSLGCLLLYALLLFLFGCINGEDFQWLRRR